MNDREVSARPDVKVPERLMMIIISLINTVVGLQQ